MKFFHHLLIAFFLFSANFFAQSDNEDYTLEEIIVTAQKTEKSLQDVPIAVSALSADDLALRQAVRFTDLQLNVPNLSYSETNFGGSSVSIRGIGRLATGISFDQSVTTHINESPWGENTNVATMFDMDRVEVLRGPQGTLFGRGTTAGLVNLVTKRPSVDSGVEGYAGYTAGEYDLQVFEGAVNIPLDDNFAVRAAYTQTERDGFTENLYAPVGGTFDGREHYVGRISLRYDSGKTVVDYMYQEHEEESTRTLRTNYVCTPSANIARGCTLGGEGIGIANPAATYNGILAAVFLESAPLGANTAAYTAFGLNDAPRPANMTLRQTHSDFVPIYDRHSGTHQLAISHDLDNGRVSLNMMNRESSSYTRMDTTLAVEPLLGVKVSDNPLAYVGGLISVDMLDHCVADQCGIKGPTQAERLSGQSGKCVLQTTNRNSFIDGSSNEQLTEYLELKYSSDLDGIFNFIIGINHYGHYEDDSYLTTSSPLTLLGDAQFFVPTTFGNTNEYQLEANGLFGELYFDVQDNLRITLGLRYGEEKKTNDIVTTTYGQARNVGAFAGVPWLLVDGDLYNCFEGIAGAFGQAPDLAVIGQILTGQASNGCGLGEQETVDLYGVSTQVNAASAALAGGIAAAGQITDPQQQALATGTAYATYFMSVKDLVPALYDRSEDYNIPGWESYQKNKLDYTTTAGRLIVDYAFSDDSLLYGSYSRGTKPAGINPPINPRIYEKGLIPANTVEEKVDSFEIGIKSILLGGQMRLNTSLFYNKYTDMQISRILATTTFNFNIDSENYGAEIEMDYVPATAPNLRLDFMFAYIKTKIMDDELTIDPFNIAAEGTKYFDTKNNVYKCIDLFYEGEGCVANTFLADKDLVNAAQAVLASLDAWLPVPGTTQADGHPIYMSRVALSALGIPTSTGVKQSIDGNRLPNTPELTTSLGISYNFEVGNGISVVPNIYYYYQSDMYVNEFNNDLYGKIDAWDEINIGLTVGDAENQWYFRFFSRNALDEDNITWKYNSTDVTGNFQSYFLRDPRVTGIEYRYNF